MTTANIMDLIRGCMIARCVMVVGEGGGVFVVHVGFEDALIL